MMTRQGLGRCCVAALIVCLAGTAPAADKPPDPANAAWTLVFEGALEGKPLTILLAAKDGKWDRAFATAFTFNQSVHDVDAGALKRSGARVEGAVEITIHPDNWVPRDKKKIACEFRVEAEAKGGKITGRYKGRVGKAQVTGEVSGVLRAAKRRMLAGEIRLRMEDALESDRAWLRRANVTLRVAHGKIDKGTIGCADPHHWAGSIRKLAVTLTPEALTGTLEARVSHSAGEVERGVYTFTLRGKVIGTAAAGTFKATFDGQPIRGGVFAATLEADAWAQEPGKKQK
jgi:hypothetical protein